VRQSFAYALIQMKFLPGNAQHIGKRSEQQDSFGFTDQSDTSFTNHAGVVAVLADGMGGLAHGKAASQAAVQAFLKTYHSKNPTESISDALLRAIHAANEAVVNVGRNTGARDGLGTTLAAAAMHQQGLHWISAGDSRVYLSSRGKMIRLTIDHVYANDLDQQAARGETTQFIAERHPERASLTSYLGLEMLPKIDRSIQPFPVQPGDWVIVCSDGLYRSVSDEEIATALRKDATRSCETLIEKAMATGDPAQDNLTVLALRCQGERLRGKVGFGELDRLQTSYVAVMVALALCGVILVSRRFERPIQPQPIERREPAVVQPLSTQDANPTRTSNDHPLSSKPAPVIRTNKPLPEPARTAKENAQTPALLGIRTLYAAPDGNVAKLVWNLDGPGSQTCKLSVVNGMGTVMGNGLPPSEHKGFRVPASEPTEYTLIAICGNKTLSQSVLVAPTPAIAK
jgi:PPM family protein phosphatase